MGEILTVIVKPKVDIALLRLEPMKLLYALVVFLLSQPVPVPLHKSLLCFFETNVRE